LLNNIGVLQKIEVKEIEDNRRSIVEENTHYIIESIPITSSLSFSLIEKDKPGTIDVEALEKAGYPPGPFYRMIKNENYTPPGLKREDIIGPDKIGRKIMIIRKGHNNKRTFPLSKVVNDTNCHTLIYETNEQELIEDYPFDKNLKIKNLILTNLNSDDSFNIKKFPQLNNNFDHIFKAAIDTGFEMDTDSFELQQVSLETGEPEESNLDEQIIKEEEDDDPTNPELDKSKKQIYLDPRREPEESNLDEQIIKEGDGPTNPELDKSKQQIYLDPRRDEQLIKEDDPTNPELDKSKQQIFEYWK